MNYPKNYDDALNQEYKFWNTQPVTKLKEIVMNDSAIKNNDNISTDQTQLIDGFEWDVIDINNKEILGEVSDFINKYYVQDLKNEFRLCYPPEYIEWLYKTHNHIILAIRSSKNNIICGLICGKVMKMQVNKNKLDLVEINLLCVHPKLRNKRMTPILITEITRLFNLKGYNYAMYNSNTYLPTPFATSKYFHRALNLEKLLETKFTRIDGKIPLHDIQKKLELPDNVTNNNFIEMEECHIEGTLNIYNKYMEKYNFHPIYTLDEFKYHFFGNSYIKTFVMVNNGIVTDFASYNVHQSKVLKNNKKYNYIQRASLYYYTCISETQYRLIKDLLILAKQNNVDVFDATDIMENWCVLRELGFEEGTGLSHYYLYNWKIKPLKNIQVAFLPM